MASADCHRQRGSSPGSPPACPDPVDCLRRVSPTVGRTASRSTCVSLPLARGLGSASGRRPAFRALSTTGSHKEGTKDERNSSRRNQVTLVGNLTADPVLKQLDDDRKMCQLRLAVNDQKDKPMFIDVATFGAQADAGAKCLSKGGAVALTARLV